MTSFFFFIANHCFLGHRSKESKVESGHSGSGGDGEMLSHFRDIWKSETESVDA